MLEILLNEAQRLIKDVVWEKILNEKCPGEKTIVLKTSWRISILIIVLFKEIIHQLIIIQQLNNYSHRIPL